MVENGKPVALGRDKNSTNIRMEARALIEAMKLHDGMPCEIHTDSEFWINVLTKWAPGWEAKGWKKSTKGEIQNLDLVQEAYSLYRKLLEDGPLAIKFVWVRAHVGNNGNELADTWANKARAGATLS